MIPTINVIDITNVSEFNVSCLLSFPDTDAGRREAEKTFKNWVREAAGREMTHAEMDHYLDVGKFEVGDGLIAMITSGYER